MAFDENLALEHYSKSGGNQLESLRSYCDEAQYKDVYGFSRTVDGIQGSLWGLVLGIPVAYTILRPRALRLASGAESQAAPAREASPAA